MSYSSDDCYDPKKLPNIGIGLQTLPSEPLHIIGKQSKNVANLRATNTTFRREFPICVSYPECKSVKRDYDCWFQNEFQSLNLFCKKEEVRSKAPPSFWKILTTEGQIVNIDLRVISDQNVLHVKDFVETLYRSTLEKAEANGEPGADILKANNLSTGKWYFSISLCGHQEVDVDTVYRCHKTTRIANFKRVPVYRKTSNSVYVMSQKSKRREFKNCEDVLVDNLASNVGHVSYDKCVLGIVEYDLPDSTAIEPESSSRSTTTSNDSIPNTYKESFPVRKLNIVVNEGRVVSCEYKYDDIGDTAIVVVEFKNFCLYDSCSINRDSEIQKFARFHFIKIYESSELQTKYEENYKFDSKNT